MYDLFVLFHNLLCSFPDWCVFIIIVYPICHHLIDVHLHKFFTCLDINRIGLTLTVLVTAIDALGPLLNRVITAQWEGMGDAGAARYKPALHPSSPTIRVLSYSNCQRSTHSSSRPGSVSVKPKHRVSC